MTRCTRCNRKLKAPTASGMGETCERYVLGPRPKRQAAQAKTARARRDDATLDLWAPNVFPWVLAA